MSTIYLSDDSKRKTVRQLFSDHGQAGVEICVGSAFLRRQNGRGLPGSGKTTYAKNRVKENRNTAAIHLDEIRDRENRKNYSLSYYIREGLSDIRNSVPNIMVHPH